MFFSFQVYKEMSYGIKQWSHECVIFSFCKCKTFAGHQLPKNCKSSMVKSMQKKSNTLPPHWLANTTDFHSPHLAHFVCIQNVHAHWWLLTLFCSNKDLLNWQNYFLHLISPICSTTYFQTMAFSLALYLALPFIHNTCTPLVFNGVGMRTCMGRDNMRYEIDCYSQLMA